MLTPQQLEEFAEYMRSGELEKDFADGCEHDRYYLLEMLEKLMDMGDLADEVSTRVIFKGSLSALLPPAAAKGAAEDGAKGAEGRKDKPEAEGAPH